jgi:hypothetical protein
MVCNFCIINWSLNKKGNRIAFSVLKLKSCAAVLVLKLAELSQLRIEGEEVGWSARRQKVKSMK